MENIEDCKYCRTPIHSVTAEGLRCEECDENVHIKCLRKGSVPGGLTGDTFFLFTCQECSTTGSERFIRDKMPWLQAIVLVLYHMQARTPGLARKGFFHWKIHIAAFIDKHWDILFSQDFKCKKKWTGTIAGTLSHYSPLIFFSGTTLFSDLGWWTLTYPKLTPSVIVQINSEYSFRKQRNKELRIFANDADLFEQVLLSKPFISKDLLSKLTIPDSNVQDECEVKPEFDLVTIKEEFEVTENGEEFTKKVNLLPSLERFNESFSKKSMKNKSLKNGTSDELAASLFIKSENECDKKDIKLEEGQLVKKPKFLDPFCYYGTSLNNLSRINGMPLSVKLTGGLREESILSPYSGLYLKPYVRRDTETFPQWLQLTAEILIKANQDKPGWKLPPRGPIDYVYVQPSHIPSINSLCNQFFWNGIDLADCLQYPDFSCVALYKRLIIGFAFLVPDVKFNENYISFIFTRPGWRNVGIAKFMLYHLIQTSTGRDLTLHVSISNPAIFLYQKFGFKVEHVDLDFYDKYLRRDTKESKHAFFCRLER